MRLVRTFEGDVPSEPDAVFAKLASETKSDGVTIVHHDDAERALWVEGAWWFHGKWTVVPGTDGGARVRLEVWSKADGVKRIVAALPVQQGLARIRKGWNDDLASLASRRPGV